MRDMHVLDDHEAIMRRAHQMRAEAMADILRSIANLFRRKPAATSAANA